MFHNLTHDLSISTNHCPDLLRQRHLLVILFLALKDIQIDARAFTRENLRAHTIFAEIHLGAVYGVHEDCGKCAKNLEGKVGGFDHVDGGDEGFDDEGETG